MTADDGAIATDKVALMPGVKAGFPNYTSYSRGVNGIMVDIRGLPGDPTLDDFAFRVGNNNDMGTWSAGPMPSAPVIRRGAGVGGSDRITLTWGADAVTRKWLQVRVRATAATGLAADDVFYFGNAIGESGNRPGLDAVVNATDEIQARLNPRSPFNPASIESAYDYNRDKQVNATDQIVARLNTTSAFTALRLITPLVGAPAPGGALALAEAGRAAGTGGEPPEDRLLRTEVIVHAAQRPLGGADGSGGVRLSIERSADGRIHVELRGTSPSGSELQMSTDPAATAWESVSDGNKALGGPGSWTRTRRVDAPAVFFRLVWRMTWTGPGTK